MKTLNFLAAAVVSAFAAAAYAGPYGPGGPGDGAGGPARGFERLRAADKDGNGSLSRDEVAGFPGLAANFDAIDANKDGQVSLQELQAMRGAGHGPRGQRWTRWDADGDGRLSREEVANAPRLAQQFDTIDANRDGVLTVEELQAARGRHAGHPRYY